MAKGFMNSTSGSRSRARVIVSWFRPFEHPSLQRPAFWGMQGRNGYRLDSRFPIQNKNRDLLTPGCIGRGIGLAEAHARYQPAPAILASD